MDARPLDSDRPDSPAAPMAARGWSAIRDVANGLRRLPGPFTLSEPVFLHCECLQPTGYPGVPMFTEAVDATSAVPGSLGVMGPRSSAARVPTVIRSRGRRPAGDT
jgi:hypothetical protein